MIKALDKGRRGAGRTSARADNQKRLQYGQIVQQYYRLNDPPDPFKLLAAFDSAGIAECWAILHHQLEDCQPEVQNGDAERLREKIRWNSVRLLERRFSASAPQNETDFESFVRYQLVELELDN